LLQQTTIATTVQLKLLPQELQHINTVQTATTGNTTTTIATTSFANATIIAFAATATQVLLLTTEA